MQSSKSTVKAHSVFICKLAAIRIGATTVEASPPAVLHSHPENHGRNVRAQAVSGQNSDNPKFVQQQHLRLGC
jgi:hypothetical protein